MTIHSYDLQYNTTQSLYHFLKTEVYARSGSASYTTGTLQTFFNSPELKVMLGFPSVLQKIKLPTIAIEQGDVEVIDEYTIGANRNFISMNYVIWGFSGGEPSEGENKKQRDQLCNDVKQLLEDSEYINYHEYPNFNTGADLAVSNVSSSYLPVTGYTDSERNRFQINLVLTYFKE